MLEDDTGGESKASFSCYNLVGETCGLPRANTVRPYIKRTENVRSDVLSGEIINNLT